jgi:hypothetical protein
MSSIFTLSGIPCWYWALALAITAYQAYRGFRFQWLLGIDSPRRIAAEAAAAQQAQVAQQPPVVQQPQIPRLRWFGRLTLLSLADFLTYALCTLSGFYAFLIAYRAAILTSVTKAPVQHPSILIFLVLYGVLGITGKLPDTLDRIKGLEWKP